MRQITSSYETKVKFVKANKQLFDLAHKERGQYRTPHLTDTSRKIYDKALHENIYSRASRINDVYNGLMKFYQKEIL